MASREDAMEGGGGTGPLRYFLPRSDTCVVVVWGGYLGVVGANGAEARGSSPGVPDTCEEVEG